MKPFVIFLNGTLQTTIHWTSQVRHLHDRFNIVLFESRAQGRSDLGNLKLEVDIHASDLAELLEYLKIAKASLVGLSHGARVALETAQRYSHFVTQMVLCSTAAKLNDRARATLTLWKDILVARGIEAAAWTILPTVLGQNYLAKYRRMLPKMVEAIVLRSRPESLIAHIDAMLEYPPPSLPLVQTGLPVLVMSGAADPLVSSEEARELAKCVDGKHVLLKGAGHSIQIESPTQFNREVDAFLRSETI